MFDTALQLTRRFNIDTKIPQYQIYPKCLSLIVERMRNVTRTELKKTIFISHDAKWRPLER
jgi:hypothetical protein